MYTWAYVAVYMFKKYMINMSKTNFKKATVSRIFRFSEMLKSHFLESIKSIMV